jgi:predicted permease
MTDRDPIWRRYRDMLRPRPADDVADEVRHHLEMRRDEALRAGLDPDDAAHRARERFGDVDGVVAELNAIDGARERRLSRLDWLTDLALDVRFAIRSLRRSPAFALTAIVTLAVAIGANTTIFSFVNALLLEPLPYQRPQELVSVQANVVGSIGEMLALRERTKSFAALALYRPRSVTVSDDREAARIDGASVTPSLLSIFGVAPSVGTIFGEEAGRRGEGRVIVLSHAFWMERYGGDRGIVGRQISVDGTPFRVLGVMPASFTFPDVTTRFWIPIAVDPSNVTPTWAFGSTGFVGRLAPGVSVERADAEVRAVLPGMRRLNPIWDPGDRYGEQANTQQLQQTLVSAERPALRLLSACVAVVLLVACVNLANLLLARVTAREREFTVRAALGGGRSRLIRQLLTESVVTSIVGGVLGTALAVAGVRWAAASMPPSVARTTHVQLDTTVLAFTAVLAIVTGFGFGLLPALRAASSTGASGAAHFGRGSVSSHQRLSSILVAGEVALAVLLAITAGLLTRSFDRLRNLSPGFTTEHVIVARVSPPSASYREHARLNGFYTTLMAQVSAIPGVTRVAVVDRLPIAAPVFGMGIRIQGQFEDGKRLLPSANHLQAISPEYFAAMGFAPTRGRAFTDEDRKESAPVAIVSQSLARRFWPNENAIGKRIGYPYESPWLTVVGVVPDVKLDSLRDTASIAVYVPFRQRDQVGSPEMTILVRSSADAASVERQLRSAVAAIDRGVPVSGVRSMDDVLSASVARPRFMTLLVGGFALAALLLGATGIYGVMSYVVSRRTHEMGVRIALGATSKDIFRLVVGRGAVLAGAGAAVGCVMALAATRALGSLLFEVSATDPLTFVTAVVVFVSVAVLASAGPARRATRADPASALRQT